MARCTHSAYAGGTRYQCTLEAGHTVPHSLDYEPREMALHTGRALVCGDCWAILRPDQYEPMGGAAEPDACSMCGAAWGGLHRVAWAEIDRAYADGAHAADGWLGHAQG